MPKTCFLLGRHTLYPVGNCFSVCEGKGMGGELEGLMGP